MDSTVMGKSLRAVISVLIGLAAVALLVAGGDMFLVAPIRAADANLIELTEQLTDIRARRRAVEADLQRESSNGAQTEDLSRVVFSTPNAASSAAVVQEQLRTFIATAGGILLSSQATSDAATEGIARVRVVFRARITEDGALAVLQWLEAERPRILVNALELQASPVLDGQPPLEFAGSLEAFHVDAD